MANRAKAVSPFARTVVEAEKCTACDAPALRHPMVFVTQMRPGEPMRAFPVCDACWREPEHRKRPIKGHFFSRDQEKTAVAMAGRGSIG